MLEQDAGVNYISVVPFCRVLLSLKIDFFFPYFYEIEMVFAGFFSEVFCCPCLPVPGVTQSTLASFDSCPRAACSLCAPGSSDRMLGARLLFGHSGCWHIGVQVLVHLPSAARPFQFSSLDLIETGNSADCLILC